MPQRNVTRRAMLAGTAATGALSAFAPACFRKRHQPSTSRPP